MLNLCRVYWYLLDGCINSKEEARAWAVRTLPAAYRPVVRQALAELAAFARHVDERLSELRGGAGYRVARGAALP